MVGLHDMLQQCGLLAVAAQEEAEAAGAAEGNNPGSAPTVHPPTLPGEGRPRQPRLVNKLAASVDYIQKHMHSPEDRDKAREPEKEQEEERKDGGGSSQEETQAASTSEVACQLASQAQGHPPRHPLGVPQSDVGGSMNPSSQGGRGCRVKLVMLVLLGLFTIAQGVLPGQTEDIDRHEERHPSFLAVDSGPTDDHLPLLARHGSLPVPDQQQNACSKAPPPLRGPSCNESKSSLRGHMSMLIPEWTPTMSSDRICQTDPRSCD